MKCLNFILMFGGTWNCNTVKLFTPKGVNVITIKMQLGFNPWNTSKTDYYRGFFKTLITTVTRENARKITVLRDHLHWKKAIAKEEYCFTSIAIQNELLRRLQSHMKMESTSRSIILSMWTSLKHSKSLISCLRACILARLGGIPLPPVLWVWFEFI